jgi:hypothetical protein
MRKKESIFFPARSLYPEDGGSNILRNIIILPQHYTASQLRRLRLNLRRGKLQISPRALNVLAAPKLLFPNIFKHFRYTAVHEPRIRAWRSGHTFISSLQWRCNYSHFTFVRAYFNFWRQDIT